MINEEPNQEPLILVAGQRVGLGALRRDLIPTYVRWRSDLEVLRALGESDQVATALLVRVDQRAGTAEFGLTIGERRNQGLGTEATKLVLDWAFTVMGLHNLLLLTFSWNLPAIRAYSKAGFREIGRRRGAVVTLGQRYDQVLMDAVADEFTDSVLAKHAPPDAEASDRP